MTMPPPLRERFERQFYAESRGRSSVTCVEAALVFLESGLPRAELGRIWEAADRHGNGRFGRDEFVHAMWLIELQRGGGYQNAEMGSQQPASYQPQPASYQQPPPLYQQQPAYQQPQPPYQQPEPPSQQSQPPQQQNPYQQQPQTNANPPRPSNPPPGEISKATTCASCNNGLAPSDTASHCQICTTYLCPSCPSRCSHPLQHVTLTLSKLTKPHAMGTLVCSGCLSAIKKGSVAWHCQKCWERDLDDKCWRKKKRHCKHVKLGKVDMVRTESMGKKEKADALGTLGDVAEALLG